MTARAEALTELSDLLAAIECDHTARIAVDGITASGKTTLADELAAAMAACGRTAVRLSMDGYHHPRAHRYRQGRGSANGYYEDAYDLAAFAELVLRPLGPGGDGRHVPAIIDLASDTSLPREPVPVPDGALLVVDGSFLQRAELAAEWDMIIWVDTAYEEARRRGATRDAALLGGFAAATAAFDTRYHPAARRSVDEVDPITSADFVFVNDNEDV